ncbi:helix-turn-helix domain-containing protein [Aeromicrobium massiliense]|uniref:helix-turn-helix domain-containing protein n=1 Tax=Aeromicrobium massiliense TaxID=1464554 RepID=UPI00155A22E6
MIDVPGGRLSAPRRSWPQIATVEGYLDFAAEFAGANFATRLFAARKSQSLTQQQLAERSGAHVTQIRRYEAGTSQPTLDVLRALALALSVSADSLLYDDDECGPKNSTLRLKLEAVDQFTPRRARARRRLHRRRPAAPPRPPSLQRTSQLIRRLPPRRLPGRWTGRWRSRVVRRRQGQQLP